MSRPERRHRSPEVRAFRNHELFLNPGDAVFQSADGVTEA